MENRETDTVLCEKCNTVVIKGHFCSNCGAKLESFCLSCGAELYSGAKFCSNCGVKVSENNSLPVPVSDDDIKNVEQIAEKTHNDSEIAQSVELGQVTEEKEEVSSNDSEIAQNAELEQVTEVKEEVGSNEINLADNLFRLHIDWARKKVIAALDILYFCINEDWDEERYIEELTAFANSNKYLSTNKANNTLIQQAILRISPIIRKGEKAIVFMDNSVMSPDGQTGTLITNKRIYSIKKRKVERLDYEFVRSMHVLGTVDLSNSWYFNDNPDINVDCLNSSPMEVGTILGAICMYSKNCHKAGYKINIY